MMTQFHLPRRIMAIVLVILLVCAVTFLMAMPAAAMEDDLTVALSLDPAILWPFLIAAGLLGLKLVFGIANAVRDKTLDARQLPAILQTNVLPYLIPLAAMAGLSLVMPVVKAIYLPSTALYIGKLVADIKDAMMAFFGLTKPPEAPAPPATQ
jgi:hypothetical protein